MYESLFPENPITDPENGLKVHGVNFAFLGNGNSLPNTDNEPLEG